MGCEVKKVIRLSLNSDSRLRISSALVGSKYSRPIETIKCRLPPAGLTMRSLRENTSPKGGGLCSILVVTPSTSLTVCPVYLPINHHTVIITRATISAIIGMRNLDHHSLDD